jgi:hypothetical protein
MESFVFDVDLNRTESIVLRGDKTAMVVSFDVDAGYHKVAPTRTLLLHCKHYADCEELENNCSYGQKRLIAWRRATVLDDQIDNIFIKPDDIYS